MNTLKKGIITEKAMLINNVYVFEVNPKATKQEITTAIEAAYGVTVSPAGVRTAVVKGKVKSVGRKRIQKQKPLKKKAYVTLSKGDISDLKVK